jgi:hypothetical protein
MRHPSDKNRKVESKLVPSVNPNKLLQRMVGTIRSAATGLFTSPTEIFVSRDKGLYAYLIGKLSKRMATTLSVDREVLILFTSFEDQQQRTIKIARELIIESNGRLESSVAVIVHNDPNGNTKLKSWGRSLGLSVLPIYIRNCPSKPTELERLLSHELFSHDPFDVTGPVSDDDNFFGRRNEAQDLARKLLTAQIRSCLGIRKIGKTSVINRIISDLRSHHDCYCAMVDCSKDEIWSLSASGLMSALAASIKAAKSSPDRYAMATPTDASVSLAEAARAVLEEIKTSGKPVIFFIDEMDYITPGSPTAAHWRTDFNSFWRNIRSIYQEAARDFGHMSMLIGGVSSKWFSVESIDGIENAALALIPEEYLSPLPRGATISMIKKVARSAGLVFSEECCDTVAAACGDMPYWVRKACSYIHRQIEGSRPLTLEESQTIKLVNEFIKAEGATIAQVAVSHLFRVFPELELPALKRAGDQRAEINKRLANILENYGIISAPGKIRTETTMIAAGLQLYQEQKQAMISGTSAAVGTESTRSVQNLEEWADDLAVINKQRNILERKLRQIVLNFLRMNTLADKTHGTVKTRILQVIASEQRKKFDSVGPDELIEKLNWLELVGLIRKEWKLFQPLLNDLVLFEQQSTIINDRPDAHAKKFDAAEFALHRKALKWLSDRIEAI